jgi:hypothetical protein
LACSEFEMLKDIEEKDHIIGAFLLLRNPRKEVRVNILDKPSCKRLRL